MNTETLFTIALAFIAVLVIATALSKLPKIRHEFIVPEGYAGLLHHHGRFIGILPPGRHVRWGRNLTVDASDTRKAIFPVASQEVLTADNIAVKFSLIVTYQIADPAKAAQATQSWHTDLYTAAQLALRGVVAGVTAEALLTQRPDLGPQLLARVQAQAQPIGLTIHAVEVKDVMLPAELKRAFADALKARQEGLAALERARGESAALRSLANAARVLDGSPALLNLRLAQTLGAAQGTATTVVVGLPGGFVPTKPGAAARRDGTDEDT